ncbi:hypothetical protein POM88_035733 [Heracleum sosnowskyi]|uniref:Uncharacterized protein n=1 Tax=Heracleum sosnowskyi TaxID=360622 RepID=A0AAD8HMZ8_9APIA|nr:hypothetical protein POM88_035733 [Heracleum sosnowskyi]
MRASFTNLQDLVSRLKCNSCRDSGIHVGNGNWGIFWVQCGDQDQGSTRQSKRLKQLQLPKTSFNSPLDLDSDNSHQDEKVQEQQILEPTKNIQAAVQKPKRYKERAKKTIRIKEDRIRRKEMGKKHKLNFQDVEEGMVKKKQINKTTKSKLGLVDEEEHGSEDSDEPNETIRKKKNVTKLFKIRNSPSNLTTMMSVLSGQQRTWVRTTGFGSLFDFNLERIPHHLAFHILQSFDASSRSLKIDGKTLPITDIDVHEVVGLPVGQKSFTYAKTAARKNLWTSQFPGKPQYNISPSTVVDIISASDEDDEIFKINFLIVLFNILIERNTSSYLLRDVLDYNIDLDNCCEYNWGELLLNSLVKTKNTWPTLSSLFYPEPIIFLTGNDAMTGKAPVSRQSQANEDMYENVGFTSAGENEQTPNAQTRENENDGPTCVSPSGQYEPTQKDWFDRLIIKVVILMDAIELYKLELEAAKSMHPNNVEISDIKGKVIAEIQKLKQSDSKPQPQSEVKSVGGIENKNEEPNVDVTFEEHEEINPDVLEELELMEYIYSSQGIRDMNEYMDEWSMPSFSLGIDSVLDVCNQINKEHGDIQSNENDMVTPTPEECEKRTKRGTNIGAAYRSPYVRRDINLGSKYSTQDYAVWIWLIQDGKDKYERVFQYGNVFCYRKHLATLSPSKKLYYYVVDVWSALMNE